jgi:hypothetical protein
MRDIFLSGLEMLASVSESSFVDLTMQMLVWAILLAAKTGKDLNHFQFQGWKKVRIILG